MLLPIEVGGSETLYAMTDSEGGQPCSDGKGTPTPKP
jgi:hypothetical protein